jgi:hypothetical protein
VIEFRAQARITQRRSEPVAGKCRETLLNAPGLPLCVFLPSNRRIGNSQHDVRVQISLVAVDDPLQDADGVSASISQDVSHAEIEGRAIGNLGLELSDKLPGRDRAGGVAPVQQNFNEVVIAFGVAAVEVYRALQFLEGPVIVAEMHRHNAEQGVSARIEII